MPTGSEIRRKFLDFFVQQKERPHKEVHSSSLVPTNDPTLLFTNAGMNQFKDVFLGLEKRDYSRATTSQKCVRAGGKHNDLENVGFTNRHHTFFEMLGNFSFGDYFKKDAIAYAWELITSPEWFGIDRNKLYVTIFEGTPLASGTKEGIPRDDEAQELWLSVGVPIERIFAMGMKDNFWQMGDTGPCGPCSEIHYDMGVAASDHGHTSCGFPCDCGRYVEIWNLVFMQYNREPRVPDGTLFGFRRLPKPSIDTGAGLERLAAVMLNIENPTKISNYDTDLFTPLIKEAVELTRKGTTAQAISNLELTAAWRIIADHARATTFLIADGVLPANEGRGYVLRKILRRAIRHGRLLGTDTPFMHRMVYAVRDVMKDAYPELIDSARRVSEIVLAEEIRFGHTLAIGLQKLEDELSKVFKEQEDAHSLIAFVDRADEPIFYGPEEISAARELTSRPTTLPGDRAFKLYDTFGLPRDFIEDVCHDRGVRFDSSGFDRAMEEQKTRARASWKGAAKQTANPVYQQLPKSVFEGYGQTRSEGCEVLAILRDGQGVQQLSAGEAGEVILDHTPFYAESGGQVGDRGWFYSDDHNTVVAEVTGCYSPIQGVRAHQVVVKGGSSKTPPSFAQNAKEGWGTPVIRVGDRVDAVVDVERRVATMRNHTATHLLHAGLREILGKHVKQAGSLVAPDHLRFDFSHFTAVEDEELQDIEDLINKELLRNIKVETLTDVPLDEAINKYHAMALFGEKYGDKVRVVRIGDFSTELCGGTHTAATGEIGLIKILKEGSVSSGVRRVEAVTGDGSLRHFRRDHELEHIVSGFIGSHPSKTAKGGASSSEELSDSESSFSPAEALKSELEKKDNEIKRLTRELDQVRMKSASASIGTANISEMVKDVKGVKVLAHRVDNLERAQLRTLVDQLRDKIGSGVVILGSASNGNVALIVGVTKDLTGRVQAGKVIAPVAQKVGGKGGGRPDLAEAGGKDASALDAALDGAYRVVEEMLA
jgi:alanyl-tRNA synthetase